MFNIVLHEPEKPDNTGNIGRTCVATGTRLHLIYPIGFNLTRKNIHHAGLDYWDRLDLVKHDSYNDFTEYMKTQGNKKVWYATTKGHRLYTDVKFSDGDYIMFGKESAGIPEEILSEDEEHCIRIPMMEGERSLNLANSVAIVLYEALRQMGFKGMQEKGELHRLSFK